MTFYIESDSGPLVSSNSFPTANSLQGSIIIQLVLGIRLWPSMRDNVKNRGRPRNRPSVRSDRCMGSGSSCMLPLWNLGSAHAPHPRTMVDCSCFGSDAYCINGAGRPDRDTDDNFIPRKSTGTISAPLVAANATSLSFCLPSQRNNP